MIQDNNYLKILDGVKLGAEIQSGERLRRDVERALKRLSEQLFAMADHMSGDDRETYVADLISTLETSANKSEFVAYSSLVEFCQQNFDESPRFKT